MAVASLDISVKCLLLLIGGIGLIDCCKFGPGCTYPCHCEGSAPCDPDTGHCDAGCDDGYPPGIHDGYTPWQHDDNPAGERAGYVHTGQWSGYGCQIGNVAFNKSARQGPETWYDNVASRAVDGNHDPVMANDHCIHTTSADRTDHANYGWWRVELGDVYVVQRVVITNRVSNRERLRFAEIIANTDTDTQTHVCTSWTDIGNPTTRSFNCTNPLKASYVLLRRHRRASEFWILNVCEIEVYGYLYKKCNGSFGAACSTPCNCREQCDDITGRCDAGCIPGYTGSECQDKCRAGSWGEGCNSRCYCADDVACRHTDGHCDTCAEGRGGPACMINFPSVNLIFLEVETQETSFSVSYDKPSLDTTDDVILGYSIQYSEDTRNWNTLDSTNSSRNGKIQLHSEQFTSAAIVYIRILPHGIYQSKKYEGQPSLFDGPYDITGPPASVDDKTSIIIGSVLAVVLVCIIILVAVVLKRKNLFDKVLKSKFNAIGLTRTNAMDMENGYTNPHISTDPDKNSSNALLSTKDDPTQADKSPPSSPRTLNTTDQTNFITQTPKPSPKPDLPRKPLIAKSNEATLTTPPPASPTPSKHSVADSIEEVTSDVSLDELPEHEYGNVAPVGRPIHVDELAARMGEMSKKPNAYRNEFMMIPAGNTAKFEVASTPENKSKNRYNNVCAYDHARVVLDVSDGGQDATDYINASYIHGYQEKENVFIAAQGPKANTREDFWRMVWQTGSNRIVMVTKLNEDGREKCSPYWDDHKRTELTSYTIQLVNSEKYAEYIIRLFSVTNKQGESRPVHHFHFLGWPDKRAPEVASPLLDFRRKLRAMDDTATGPIIVHCSAGIGRTGTFIAIDTMLQQATMNREIDLFRYVGLMRSNRKDMIQMSDQYIFVYEAVLEWLRCGNPIIPCSHMTTEHPGLIRVNPDSGKSKLQEQFELLDNLKPALRDEKFIGLEEQNLDKNRSKDIIPSNRVRPILSTPVQGTTDYINAAYVDGFRDRQAFAVTQLPLPHTVPDFWRLVYDHKCHSIVLLHPVSTQQQDVPVYWPTTKETPMKVGPLTIRLEKEDDVKDGIITREFTLTYQENTQTIQQFELQGWPEDTELPPSCDNLLHLYDRLEGRQQKTGNRSVVVQCKYGVRHSGIFVCGSHVLEKLKVNQEIDVFHAVKLSRMARPQLITSLAQYNFLHDLAMAYMKNYEEYANFT